MSTDDSGTAGTSRSPADVLDSIRGTHDSMSVSRAYGDPYELDGVTIIPVARVSGGAGGGGGEGSDDEGSTGGGFGTGFGLHVNPVGVYEVRGDQVEWKPALDVARLARGGQILAGVVAVCVMIVAVVRARVR